MPQILLNKYTTFFDDFLTKFFNCKSLKEKDVIFRVESEVIP